MQKQTHTARFDMTEGSIIRQLLLFSWPLFVGNIFQQLYNTVDSIIVGNFIGSNALAAVGVYSPMNNLLIGLFTGISTGATVIVSQSCGSKNNEKLNKSILVSIWLTVISGVLFTGIGLFIIKWLLQMIHTPAEIFDMALTYSRVMFLGIISVFFYNILCGILRGMGDSIIPLVILIVSNIINGIFLYIFVVILKFGIKGAAYATLLAQTTAAVVTFIYLILSQKKYDINLSGIKPDWSIGKELISIGLPAGLQSAIFSVGFLLQQNLINSFGSVLIASYTIVTRVDQFVMMPMNSFATAITTFVGQNIGALKIQRTQSGIKKTLILSQFTTIGLVALLFVFGDNVMSWFTKDIDVVKTGTNILRTLSAGYILVNTYVILSGAVRGAGDSVAPLMASFFCNVILRVSSAYLIVKLTGNSRLIFVCIASCWTLASIFMIVYYKKGIWRKKIRGIF